MGGNNPESCHLSCQIGRKRRRLSVGRVPRDSSRDKASQATEWGARYTPADAIEPANRMALDQRVNAEAGQWFAAAIQKGVRSRLTAIYQPGEHCSCSCP